ncbi:MAG TPA: ABC transporter ATP-binding protein [Pedobacter sp.]|uniref:ABC transporter ATP-binding protein n=1 Tax=Pedobacter sp. TaxID=1411316 RepID=UPI002D1BE970|nr:ABC transporter ATP-binding protein [Pedobacter sp.]HMI02658.1 ABC transporter ATP-binding protein [Pedobacter sp.]
MTKIAIKAEKITKAYFTDKIGTGTITRDFERWLAGICGKADPYLPAEPNPENNFNVSQKIFWALKNISFEINQGEVVGLAGHNGAGKSTLLKILSRITTPTSGKIIGTGRIISLLEIGSGFHPELTGRENIHLNGAMLGMRKSEIKREMDAILFFAEVEKYIDIPVKRYSSGMYTRLAFSIASHLYSDVLIVDEVLAVGDHAFQLKCIDKLKSLSRDEGKTIILVSHNSENIKSFCHKEIKLINGQLSCQ